jgi:uncharacterized damage-inducible protein DinB
MPNEHLQRLFRHNRWANRRIMAACRDLGAEQLATSVPGTYGRLDATLAHLAAAEAGYAWRFDQEPDRFRWDDEDPVPPVATLASVLEATGTRFVELAATTPDDRVLVYEVEGEERRWPAWVVLGQVIDHAREHRSHAATILTQLGIEPPDMDLWAYGEAVQAGEAE